MVFGGATAGLDRGLEDRQGGGAACGPVSGTRAACRENAGAGI